MSSIYHLFDFLIRHRDNIRNTKDLEELPFDSNFVSSTSKGRFPDLAIRINTDNDDLTGGEFVEFKSTKGNSIPSFNSTIPTGKKPVDSIMDLPSVVKQMEKAGNQVKSLPVRDVYYLINNNVKGKIKVILVHGSFFETIPKANLIKKSVLQIIGDLDKRLSNDIATKINSIEIPQEAFSQTRPIDGASVTIRFRIMTEVDPKANLLSPKQYPEIVDDTLNLCIPYKDKPDKEKIIRLFKTVVKTKPKIIELTHKVNNNNFIIFQIPMG